MSLDQNFHAGASEDGAGHSLTGGVPGKSTRTASLAGSGPGEGGVAAGSSPGLPTAPGAGSGDNPFGMHLVAGGVIARRSDGGAPGADAGSSLDRAAGESGAALPETSRTAAERSLGVDLSAVRVHTGPVAEQAAAGISAQAYTQGSDIYFGAGRYAPGSAGGDQLIAHELVHVAQQGGAQPATQRQALVTDVAEPAELEADRGADAILAGRAFSVQERPTGIARFTTAPENIAGNPGERGTVGGGTATTTHRTPTLGDSANAPAAAAAAPNQARAANVKVKATREHPLHFVTPVCPLPDAIYEESFASPPPPDFTAVTQFRGNTDNPMVEQVASPGVYINNQPTADDVQQASIGDCYFLAALCGIASRDPGRLRSMIAPDGVGGATITLWRRSAHTQQPSHPASAAADTYDYTPVQVAVSADLAVNISNGRVHGAQLRCAPQPASYDYWSAVNGTSLELHRKDVYEVGRWAPLMEKAYARFTQQHGQYGGAVPHQPGAAAGTPGYDGINSGVANHALHVLYGEAADQSGALTYSGNLTAFPTAGNNILAANQGAVNQLLRLVGRQDTRQPTDADAVIITANTNPDAQTTNLNTAITNAMADPDWVALGADTHARLATLRTAVTTYLGTAPDPAGTPGPKAAALTAVGNAAVEAARTPNHDHLADLRAKNPTPVLFDKGSDVVPTTTIRTGGSPGLDWFGRWLEFYSTTSLCPFVVNVVGHASSEGRDAENLDLSQRRATSTNAAVQNGRDATKMARHTYNVSAVGETGAAATPEWRRADITVEAGAPDNELLAGARSGPLRAMMDLVLNVRNLGTDNSIGQRNVYAGHAYNVIGVAFVTTGNEVVHLEQLPEANRPTMYNVVDCEVSTVRLRNPHHGNEPDRTGMHRPTRAGDGATQGAASDGIFTMSINEFFRNFNTMDTGVFPGHVIMTTLLRWAAVTLAVAAGCGRDAGKDRGPATIAPTAGGSTARKEDLVFHVSTVNDLLGVQSEYMRQAEAGFDGTFEVRFDASLPATGWSLAPATGKGLPSIDLVLTGGGTAVIPVPTTLVARSLRLDGLVLTGPVGLSSVAEIGTAFTMVDSAVIDGRSNVEASQAPYLAVRAHGDRSAKALATVTIERSWFVRNWQAGQSVHGATLLGLERDERDGGAFAEVRIRDCVFLANAFATELHLAHAQDVAIERTLFYKTWPSGVQIAAERTGPVRVVDSVLVADDLAHVARTGADVAPIAMTGTRIYARTYTAATVPPAAIAIDRGALHDRASIDGRRAPLDEAGKLGVAMPPATLRAELFAALTP